MPQPKTRVLVLFGGQSSEHPVSCVTAAGVLKSIDDERFDTLEVGITRSGQWTRPQTDPRQFSFATDQLPYIEPAEASIVLNPGIGGSTTPGAEVLEVSPDGSVLSLGHVDVVLPLLHGPYGEDGSVQGVLETAGLPYVGAGVLASGLGMDKHFMKVAFEAAGLNVGPYEVVTAKEWHQDPSAAVARIRRLNLPLFVKPARAGSSVGISRVNDLSALSGAIETAQQEDPKVVVEAGIAGREIECGVLDSPGGEPARASLLGEIIVGDGNDAHQFYDFTTKYTDDATAHLSCPADLPEEVAEEIRRQAVIAFDSVGAEGLSRVDFFYDSTPENLHDAIVINEINTMPGFTPISMYPQMWKATGLSYTELITELIELALSRPLGLR